MVIITEIDIFKHELMPVSFRILNKNEKENLLKRYGITPDKLPKIIITDPVVKKIGAKVNDIIEIKRNSEIAGEVLYYRIVVSKVEEFVEEEIEEVEEESIVEEEENET